MESRREGLFQQAVTLLEFPYGNLPGFCQLILSVCTQIGMRGWLGPAALVAATGRAELARWLTVAIPSTLAPILLHNSAGERASYAANGVPLAVT